MEFISFIRDAVKVSVVVRDAGGRFVEHIFPKTLSDAEIKAKLKETSAATPAAADKKIKRKK